MRTELIAEAPDRPRGLLQGMSWSVLGQAVAALSQWGILVVLIKQLDAESVGQFALALAVAGPVYAFSGLQLSGLLASDQSREYVPAAYVTLRLVTSLAAYAVLGGLLAAGALGPRVGGVLLLVGLIKLCEAASDLLFGFLQQRERIDQVGWLQVVRGVGTLACVWVTLALTPHLWVALTGLLACQVCLTLFVDARALETQGSLGAGRSAFRPSVANWPEAQRLFRLALPMGLVIGLNVLTVNIPRYWIAGLLGDAAVGVYAALSYVMSGGSMTIGAVAQAAVPRLARLYRSDRTGYRVLLLRLAWPAFGAGIAGVLLAVVAGGPLLTLLYNSSYSVHTQPFVWIMVGAGISYLSSVAGCALTAARILRAQAWLTLGATAATALASALLIPPHGLLGAALAMCFGYGVKLSGQIIVLAATRQQRSNGVDLP